MRVLILEPSGQMWGAERVLLELIDALPTGSVDLAVCCPPNVPILEQFRRRSIRYYDCFTEDLHKKSRPARVLALLRFLAVVRKWRPDVIYLSQGGCAKFGVWARKLLGVPVVAGVKLVEDIAYLSSATGRQLDRIICVSSFIRRKFIENAVIDEHALELIYDPYVPHYDWSTTPPLLKPQHPDTFVCTARLAHSKGEDMVVWAASVLKREGCPVRITPAGDAEQESPFGETLSQLADEFDVADGYEWLGARSDFFHYGEGCVGWLCPSRFDPFPRVMLSSIDSGSFPIGWTGSGGPAEFISASGGGLLYEDTSPESIASAMKQAMSLSAEERRALVEGGRKFIREHCDPVRNAAGTLAVWAACANSKP